MDSKDEPETSQRHPRLVASHDGESRPAGSSYISSLSHALDINTPKSARSKSSALSSANGLRTPTTPVSIRSQTRASVSTVTEQTSSHVFQQLPSHELAAPYSTGPPENDPYGLSLQGHEAFSPSSRVTPNRLVFEVQSTPRRTSRASFQSHSRDGRSAYDGTPQTTAPNDVFSLSTAPATQDHGSDPDQAWFLSSDCGAVADSGFARSLVQPWTAMTSVEAFKARSLSFSPGSRSHACSFQPCNQILSRASTGDHTPSANEDEGCLRGLSSFKFYRDRATSDVLAPSEGIRTEDTDVTQESGPLSPASVASLSPAHLSSAFPAGVAEGSFLDSIFEQQTPSMSTNDLPGNDLTLQFGSSEASVFPTSSAPPFSANASRIAQPRSLQLLASPSMARGTAERSVLGSNSVPSFRAAGMSLLTTHPNTDAISKGAALRAQKKIDVSSDSRHIAIAAQQANREHSPHTAEMGSGSDAKLTPRHGVQSTPPLSDALKFAQHDDRPAELGLGIQHIGLSAWQDGVGRHDHHASAAKKPELNEYSMVVDEMGRWAPSVSTRKVLRGKLSSDTNASLSGQVLVGADEKARQACAGNDVLTSGAIEHALHVREASSLDGSFYDESVSLDSVPRKTSSNGSFDTPASSIGSSMRRATSVNDVLPPSGKMRTTVTSRKAEDVAMHDFSEFGQSVPIEQMAEDRWRTWPRHRVDISNIRPEAPTALSTAQTGSISSAVQPAILSASHTTPTSSRSRLLVEPYNKHQRSGRPSSGASTSSRSSTGIPAGEAASLTMSGTGPTRPRSHLATGSLRMSSSSSRPGSSNMDPPSSSNSSDRRSASAMALRRARGLSQGSLAPMLGSKAMLVSQSHDPSMTSPQSHRRTSAIKSASEASAAALPRPQSMHEATIGSHLPAHKRDAASLHTRNQRVGFNEVSAALDTLRLFLRQKDGTSSAERSSMKPNELDSDVPRSVPDQPARMLRRATGVLPPRGALGSNVDEFGSIGSPPPLALSSATVLPHNSNRPRLHGRSLSLADTNISAQSKSLGLGGNRQEDRLAVLEDLSKRVMKLKQQAERLEEERDAVNMPPPTSRPTSVNVQSHAHSQSPSSMTRREMHEQYLRKRHSGGK
ncbi:hypothetical protein BCV70DRAFT_97358 [Testicularia cyperi]|uniref:Uncharacterized protein n=1 Tax=Testicularia cyperi TaxID=1882483 RepID=A0A317XT90_9BASI|nr:hypothetical protein BCV70DRAFT_97358 [Testicularia cyperi]